MRLRSAKILDRESCTSSTREIIFSEGVICVSLAVVGDDRDARSIFAVSVILVAAWSRRSMNEHASRCAKLRRNWLDSIGPPLRCSTLRRTT